ncbi:hypothetical protein [Nonomuraea sp. NPDC049028]|uniref:hypothetical protein n=1 Tax=Nonomuraea sp. NPDC049028 TaxID=3364348 RepID=UPI003710F2C9
MSPETSFIARLIGALARTDIAAVAESHDSFSESPTTEGSFKTRLVAALARYDSPDALTLDAAPAPEASTVRAKSTVALADILDHGRRTALSLTRRTSDIRGLARDLALAGSKESAISLALAMSLAIADELSFTLNYIQENAHRQASALTRTLNNDFSRGAERARALAQTLEQASKVDDALRCASCLSLTLARSPSNWVGMPHEMKRVLDRTNQLNETLRAALTTEYAQDLERASALIAALTQGLTLDLSGADLKGADLSSVNPAIFNLSGALWSSNTRWPPAMAHRIRKISTEIEPGVFRIHGEQDLRQEASQ